MWDNSNQNICKPAERAKANQNENLEIYDVNVVIIIPNNVANSPWPLVKSPKSQQYQFHVSVAIPHSLFFFVRCAAYVFQRIYDITKPGTQKLAQR